MKKNIIFILLLGLVLALVIHYLNTPAHLVEEKRITSPDGKVDAIIATRNVNATVAKSIFIVIVPVNGKVSDEGLVLSADNFTGLNVFWNSTNELIIQYSKMRIFKFTNFWQSREVENFNYKVSINIMKQN